MRPLRMLLVTVLVAVTVCLVGGPASAGESRPVLERVTPRAGQPVVFKGRAKPRQVVKLQARGPSYWTTVGKDRASRNGAFQITVPYPDQPSTYRVVAGGKVGATRKVVPAATPATPAATPQPKPKPPAPSDTCGVRPERADGGYYSCTFRDDFDGTELDRSKWMVQESSFSGMVGGSMGCYVDNERTVGVSSGLLRLTSTILPEQFLCTSPYGSWMTDAEVSTVATRSRFTQAYGRFEARIKMPAEAGTPGSHSAFWLYPQQETYGAWPASGEVDVAEWFSAAPSNVYPSVHYAGENTALSSGYSCAMPTSSTDFHTYAVEWEPSVMRFYYDGRLCYSHSWTPTGQTASQPFDKPFYMILTQVWGGMWNARTDAMADTSTLLVDYVKAWQ